MKLHILQHVPFEGPAGIEDWAAANGHELSTTRFYAQEHFPHIERFDVLVVLGGPMSIHDEHLYTWLKGEKWFIRQVIEAGKPIMGICLGAQLLADALGASVYPGDEKEIGWFPITLDEEFAASALANTLPEKMTVFHWHGETFDLPEKAQRIASSKAFENQGFIYDDRVIGLQFHLETTPYAVESIVEHCSGDLVEGAFVQDEATILSDNRHYKDISKYMKQLLDYLFKISN